MPSNVFDSDLGMRIRIILTNVFVFGLVAAVIGLLLVFLGYGGSQNIFLWMLVSFAIIAIQWYLAPTIIKWSTGAKELSPAQAPEIFEMVRRLSSRAGIPMPKVYLVNNPSPNAFAFGRTQSDSAVAVHSGLLSVLNKEELEGVLAHEIGHISNRDVAVMTLASTIPVMLYYAFLIFGRDNENGRGSLLAIAGAFIAQFIGQLLVMWLSRYREYLADEFSARLTGNPVALMSALAKISYGFSNKHSAASNGSLNALYIAEPSSSKMEFSSIASAISAGNEKELLDAMEKEKRSGAFELLMTHPLTSKRLVKLNKLRKGM